MSKLWNTSPVKKCDPPLHYYTALAYQGIRELTCECGHTISKFNIVKNTGQIIQIALNVAALGEQPTEN